MIYQIYNSSDYMINDYIISDLYRENDFTLTVNAVNDAPVLLQSFEDLGIPGGSGTAAVVLSTK